MTLVAETGIRQLSVFLAISNPEGALSSNPPVPFIGGSSFCSAATNLEAAAMAAAIVAANASVAIVLFIKSYPNFALLSGGKQIAAARLCWNRLGRALDAVSRQDALSWFEHCGYDAAHHS
jgi:hypothetical protein